MLTKKNNQNCQHNKFSLFIVNNKYGPPIDNIIVSLYYYILIKYDVIVTFHSLFDVLHSKSVNGDTC